MELFVNAEVQGFREKFLDVNELKGRVLECLDDTVETVMIKKRAASDSPLTCGAKDTSSSIHNHR